MPKYFCDYCDTHLTHDSPSVRKTHNSGRKHKDSVKLYYMNWLEQEAQQMIDQSTGMFKGGPGLPLPGMMPPPGMVSGHPGMLPPPNPMALPPRGVMGPPPPGMMMAPGMAPPPRPGGFGPGMIRPDGPPPGMIPNQRQPPPH